MSGARSWALTWLALLAPAAAGAAVCSVPGTHPSVQSAVDDPTCTEVDLASQPYAESVLIGRSLILSGVPGGNTVLRGSMTLSGEVAVELADLRVSSGGGDQAILLTGGAMATTRRVEVTRDDGFPWIFSDGFESGDTGAWSSTAG